MTAVPVTRLADLTPLDRLGLPVWAAVTPLACDLTTHLGKGTSRAAARVSALMEAIERRSAETFEGSTWRASWQELVAAGMPAIDPRRFDLPHDTAFHPSTSFTWLAAEDIAGGGSAGVALDLVLSPPGEGLLRHVDTNGLASGNIVLEATVHALAEVIERDAVSIDRFAELYLDPEDDPPPRQRIDPRTLPPAAGAIVETAASAGLKTVIDWLETDIAVATFRAVLIDRCFPSPDGPAVRCFLGYGTAPDAELGVLRALTEAVQSRLAVIQGARDAFNRPAAPDRTRQLDGRDDFSDAPCMPLGDVPSFATIDLAADLDWLIARLAEAGLERVLRVDLTRPDLGVAVVRVRVPGLACFAVNQQRIGWRLQRYLL